MGERIKTQQKTLANFNQRLHEINFSLQAMLTKHDLEFSIKILDAKRKHTQLAHRCLVLATKVQVLRNRGYVMVGEEEEVKRKLTELDRGVNDPGLYSRSEELWARMVGVRERARILREEMGKSGRAADGGMDDEMKRKAEKVCVASYWLAGVVLIMVRRSWRIMVNSWRIYRRSWAIFRMSSRCG